MPGDEALTDVASAPAGWPEGRIIVVLNSLHTSYGGMTASALQRARALYTSAGVVAPVVTLAFIPRYGEVRRALQKRGELLDEVGDINLYEHFRAADVAPAGARSRLRRVWLAAAPRRLTRKVRDENGVVVMRSYETKMFGLRQSDYLRPDGSCYLTEYDSLDIRTRRPTRRIVLRDAQSRVVQRLNSKHELRLRFLQDLAAGGRLFVIADGVGIHDTLADARPDKVFVLPVVHNAHTFHPRHHHSPLLPNRKNYFLRAERFDAVILLTQRQKQDVIALVGPRNNLFVVPHAIRYLPELPTEGQRERRTCVMLASLESRKRIGHAIRAFAIVVKRFPDARLEIYGRGEDREKIAELIVKHGLRANVELMGYQPGARKRLTEVTALLLTSRFEGQPLVVLESMAAGCPVISFDIKYGPSDMIVDGEHGFLVPDGNVAALAESVLKLMVDDDLASQMSTAARQRAVERFGEATMVERWRSVLHTIVAQRPLMTALRSMTIDAEHAEARATGEVAFSGELVLDADVPQAARDSYQLGARVYSAQTADFVELSPKVERLKTSVFRYEVVVDPGAVEPEIGPGPWNVTVWAAWNNSFLESPLGRPASSAEAPAHVLAPGQLSLSADGSLNRAAG